MTARQGRQLFGYILYVSPAPNSLVYTSPIFRRLRAFGEVVSFKKVSDSTASPAPPYPDQQYYRVAFAEQSDLHQALVASPFTLEVDHDLPSPRSLDAYNVFGLQDRKHPEPRSFVCQLTREETAQTSYTASFGTDKCNEAPPKMRLVKDEKTGPLYKSLLEAGVPLGQLEGLATSRVPVPDDADSPEQLLPGTTGLPPFPKLMDMYRSATTRYNHGQPAPADEVLEENRESQVPVRKMYIGKPTKPFRYWMGDSSRQSKSSRGSGSS